MKKIKIIIILLVTLVSVFGNKIVEADSGWDSSYDSSSSWDSDTSWDSSSSWSGDSSWSGTTYYGGDLEEGGMPLALFIVLIIIFIYVILKRTSGKINISNIDESTVTISTGLSSDEIKEIDPSLDKESLKKQVFDIYKDVQIAWMNFDDNKLRTNLTDEIYNMYSSQLKTLKLKNQKNIMEDITLNQVEITDISIDNGIEQIEAQLIVTQYDYVVDKTNKVVRGTDQYKNKVHYKITLVRHMENNKLDKCPNCGAPIDIVSGGTCPYCNTTIINQSNEFIMSKKECLNQTRTR